MDGMGWMGWDLSQTTTTTRAPLAVLIITTSLVTVALDYPVDVANCTIAYPQSLINVSKHDDSDSIKLIWNEVYQQTRLGST